MDERFALRLPAELLQWARAAAKAERRSLANLMRHALEDYLSRHHADLG